MSDVDDAKEFADAGDAYEEPKENDWDKAVEAVPGVYSSDSNEPGDQPGQPVQYALYGAGYTATTATIKSLPSGCYDIHADNKCVYVQPALKPSGLLLELPEMRSEEVIQMVDNFWDSEKDYKEGNEFVIGGAAYKAGIMIYGPPGCHSKGTKILMFDGSIKKVEDIIIGDQIMGPDSKSRIVLELKRGKEKMVRVTPTKGDPFIVNRSHILHLTPSGKKEIVRCPINISVSDFLLHTTDCFKERYKLTRSPVNFNKKELKIPPYILGLWLGDGNSNGTVLTSMDNEIIKAWTEYGKNLGLHITVGKQRINSKANTYTISSQQTQGKHGRNIFLNKLKELNILNNKHIPISYLTSNREDRLSLLAGLIDTDGSANENIVSKGKRGVGYDFISKWEHLANQVVFLCRSLGFAAYMKKCTKGCYVKKQQYFSGEYYRVSISGDLIEVPVLLSRKKCKSRTQIKNVLRTGLTLEELPEDDFYGFTLNGDHLYLTDDFTIHHNSGKSCTIKLVSNKLVDRGGTVFYASGNPSRVSAWLSDFARVENNRKSIVIFEDIDSLISSHGEDQYLEMLDSAKSINNVLFIATTNYPEKLDPRIYNRPGRFSHVIKIGLPGDKTREAYLKAILKNHRDIPEIVAKSSGFTIDHLTALVNAVYREKKKLANEIDRLRTMFRMPKADDSKSIGIGNK